MGTNTHALLLKVLMGAACSVVREKLILHVAFSLTSTRWHERNVRVAAATLPTYIL